MKFNFFPEDVAEDCVRNNYGQMTLVQVKNTSQRFFYCADPSYAGHTYLEQFGYVLNKTVTGFFSTTPKDTACVSSCLPAGKGDIVICKPSIAYSFSENTPEQLMLSVIDFINKCNGDKSFNRIAIAFGIIGAILAVVVIFALCKSRRNRPPVQGPAIAVSGDYHEIEDSPSHRSSMSI